MGAVLGERFGVFAGLVQLVAYLLLAVMFARTLEPQTVDADEVAATSMVGKYRQVLSTATRPAWAN